MFRNTKNTATGVGTWKWLALGSLPGVEPHDSSNTACRQVQNTLTFSTDCTAIHGDHYTDDIRMSKIAATTVNIQ